MQDGGVALWAEETNDGEAERHRRYRTNGAASAGNAHGVRVVEASEAEG